MYTLSTVFTTLQAWVGFRQGYLTENQKFDANNIASSSGVFVTDFNRLCTAENLISAAPEGLSDANFNNWMDDLQAGAAAKVLNRIFAKMVQPNRLMEKHTLYTNENVITNTLTLEDNTFYGYEIELSKSINMRLNIERIGFYFDGTDATGFNLYLFNSGLAAALNTNQNAYVANTESWVSQSLSLDFSATYVGNKFYIGYRSQDVSDLPINREWDRASIQNISKYFTIRPISAPMTGTTLFDVDDIDGEGDTLGLNFQFAVQQDYTQFIGQHTEIFANAYTWQVAFDCLNTMINSTRTNGIKKETRAMALAELGLEEGNIGVKSELDEAVKDAVANLEGLDRVTMDKRQRLQKGTVR